MLKYVGDGAFLPGVPARDLHAEEVEQYGGEEALVASGLYKPTKVGPSETKPVKPEETKK